MGTNNLFHKRKFAKNLARRRSKRAPYSKVLIVCEGEVTEPNYFNGLIRHYKISSVNVKITGEGGSSPKSVVELAKSLYEEEKQLGDPYDKVYCVFDKDNHPTYQATLNKLYNMKPKDTFVAITSVPAFEYWFLLHYGYSTKPYKAISGGQSAGAQVESDLKQYLPSYRKNRNDMFLILKGKLGTAKTNAAHVLQAAKKTGTSNPSTRVHELVGFLQTIKPPKH